MTHFRVSFVLLIIAVVQLVGCTLIGYGIDDKLAVESPKPPSRVYVDGNGEGRHIVQGTHNKRSDHSFASMGVEIDKKIVKALTTRREESDMAVRDETGCPHGEVKVCSISEGCTCEVKRGRLSN